VTAPALRDTRNKGLTKADVAVAGAAVLQEVGVERVSMRLVAQRLGVSPMALYNHVADKDDLLELIAAFLREQVHVDPTLPPREQLLSLLVQLRDLGAQHPRLLDNPLALVGTSPEALEVPLRMLRLLAELGLDAERVRAAYNTLSFIVTGAAAVQRAVATTAPLPTLRARETALRKASSGADRDLVDAVLALPRTSLDAQLALAVDQVLGL
jgi:AcrR family transcriptional regulator